MSKNLSKNIKAALWEPVELKALLKCHKKCTLKEATVKVNEVSEIGRTKLAVANCANKQGIKLTSLAED